MHCTDDSDLLGKLVLIACRGAMVAVVALGSKGAALAKSAGGVKGMSLLAGAGVAAAAGEHPPGLVSLRLSFA